MLLMLPLVATAQPKVLLLSHVEGTNKYTHSNIDSIANAVHGYLTANGVCSGDISYAGNALNNSFWPDYEQSGNNWCIVVNISSSGSGFADELAEKAWWLNLPINTRIINIHSSCGDANRHSSVPGAPTSDDFFAEMFSLASLTSTGISRFPTMSTNWTNVTDEVYWLSDQHWPDNDSYWNATNIGVSGWYILARADENGPFPNGHQVPVIWEVYNSLTHHIINISYGHGPEIHTAGTPQFEMMTGILQYALDSYVTYQGTCSCISPAPLNIRQDTLLTEPIVEPDGRIYKWYTIDSKFVGESEYPPLSNTLLIRRAYGVKPKLIYNYD